MHSVSKTFLTFIIYATLMAFITRIFITLAAWTAFITRLKQVHCIARITSDIFIDIDRVAIHNTTIGSIGWIRFQIEVIVD